MDKYLANAVLSYIEEREQELILSMKYDEWVLIDDKTIHEIALNMVKYADMYSIALLDKAIDSKSKDELYEIIRRGQVVEKTLCYLYKCGIYGDGSPQIVIHGVPAGDCDKVLCSGNPVNVKVRSRFIEVAKYLYLLKQRFPDRTSFEAVPLVDRVFAYAEPRRLPVGKHFSEQVYKEITPTVRNLYEKFNELLNRAPKSNEFDALEEILQKFLKQLEEKFNIVFYDYQVRGIKSILESVLKALSGGELELKVIEAPTGAGKTEVFIIAILIASLIRKMAFYYSKRDDTKSPLAIITYPRLALAANQIERLVKYLHILNEILGEYDIPLITLSMNYTDVRYRGEYERAVEEYINGRKSGFVTLKYGVKVRVGQTSSGKYYVELRYFKCYNDVYPKLLYDSSTGRLDTSKVYCDDELNEGVEYIRVTKNDVRKHPGDIHVTLFETIRYNLLSSMWRRLFGRGLDGPIIIVLDEIHTYVGIRGARYAYVLRRLLARVKMKRGSHKLGFVVIGVSATIPNPEEFLRDLFLQEKINVEQVIIRPRPEETVPMGNEHFYIVVPTSKYLVDPLSVTIQTVMALYFNTPGFSSYSSYVKKGLVFIDNLDVVSRAYRDLDDAINRSTRRREPECGSGKLYGLQDLRNPEHPCFDLTRNDYDDNLPFDISKLEGFNSWKDGELWWPYAIEYTKVHKYKQKQMSKIVEYTSRRREPIEDADVVVTTSALEVGINYRDVVLTYQHGAPVNISTLVQRAGRAGRRIFENPLTRTVVAIQLSPDIPTQIPYFELFTRSRSLREALQYDRLYVTTLNSHVIRQTVVEAMIDYMVASGLIKSEIILEAGSEVKNAEYLGAKFECEILLNAIERIKEDKNLRAELLEYMQTVVPQNERVKNLTGEIKGFVDGVLDELYNMLEYCRQWRRGSKR